MRNQILSWLDGKETYDSKGQRVIRFYFNEKGVLQYEKEREFVNPPSVIRRVASTKRGSEEIVSIFGSRVLDFPKPVELLTYLINLTTGHNDLVLDSFAGSGTTAHAVLALNKEDGGSRRFILVECEDYADEITAERVRRVIKGVPGAKDVALREGLGGSFSYFELGEAVEAEKMLSGERLPTFADLARYVFYTATGEEFDTSKVNEETGYIGESANYKVYLFYRPDLEYLKNTALTLERAAALGSPGKKQFLVFAPTKYMSPEQLEEYRIVFAQLPFEIYELAR